MTHKHVDCPDCYGRGFMFDPAGSYGCPRCNGTGIYASQKWLLLVAVGLCFAVVVGLGVWLGVA